MKKLFSALLAIMMITTMLALTGCQNESSDPGTPPEEVIRPGVSDSNNTGNETGNSQSGNSSANGQTPTGSGEMMENAISVRIGRDSSDELSVNIIDNAAAGTMLDYLSGSALLFPTYTYDEDAGFVGQSVRGSYTRDDEVTVTDIKAGELYLFSGGQLRLYFKDVPGANITATPIGVFADTSVVNEAVTNAYESNQGDTWGVDVYFWITKQIS